MATPQWLRRMPRSARASGLLTATAFVVAATLGLWLVFWLLFVRPKVNLVEVAAAEAPTSLRWLPGLFRTRPDPEDRRWETARLDAADANFLRSHADRPTILYLTSPVAGTPAPGRVDESWKGVVAFGEVPEFGLRRLVTLCRERRRRAKLLLVIDPGRAGLDPAFARSATPMARELEQLRRDGTPPEDPDRRRAWLEDWRNLGILCACAPGQLSWPIEGEGRTAFDRSLAQELARPQKLKKAIAAVQAAVAGWVEDNIASAVQTPIYLGDPDLDFFVPGPASKPSAGDEAGPSPDESETWARLREEYRHHADLAGRRPYRYAPAEWRRYQDGLLSAERLFRARRFTEAHDAVNAARAVRTSRLTIPGEGLGSLALGLAFGADRREFERLDRELVEALEDRPAPPAAPKKADEPEAPAPGFLRRPPEGRPSYPNPWEPYAEGQLIGWINRFLKLRASAAGKDSLSDDRRALFARAIGLRRRAERASASAFDGSTPLRRLIEEGDHRLRRAQDRLFLGQADARNQAAEELNRAEDAYGRAEEYARALDLLGQVRSELPYLGAWYVRQMAREGRDGVEDLDRIDQRLRALVDRLDRSPPDGGEASGRAAFFDGLRGDREGLRAAYRRLQDEIEGERLALKPMLRPASGEAPAGPVDWREADDLLLVPGRIDPEERIALVEAARSFRRYGGTVATAAELAAKDAPPAKPEGKGELFRGVLSGSARGQGLDRIGRALDATGSGPQAPARAPGRPAQPDPDRAYARIEAGMARLAAILDAIDGPAARSSPIVDRYEDLLHWMAGRLLEDGDPEGARRFLDAATAPPRPLLERAKRLKDGPWFDPVAARCEGTLELADVPMDVDLHAGRDVPSGLACLLVDADPTGEVAVARRDDAASVGVGASVSPGQTESLRLAVHRRFPDRPAESTAKDGPVSVALTPRVFYRGRVDEGRPSGLTIQPPSIRVRLVSDKTEVLKRLGIEPNKDPKVPVKIPDDQFSDPRHREGLAGYAYPGCRHPCRLMVEFRPRDAKQGPVGVDVEWGLDAPPGGERQRASVRLEPGKPVDLGRFEIDFSPRQPMKDPPKGGEFLREQDLVVQVRKGGQGGLLCRQVIRLYEVNPDRWNRVGHILLPRDDRHDEGQWVKLTVSRSRDDHVFTAEGVKIEAPEGFRPVKKADLAEYPLKKGESHGFEFYVPAPEKDTRYEFRVIFYVFGEIRHAVTVRGQGAAAPAAAEPARPSGGATGP